MNKTLFPERGLPKIGKERFEIREVEKPTCRYGEVLIKVKACAVCGTDLRIFRRQKKIDVPITGHEISGVIEEVGEGVQGLTKGDKIIVVETVIGCGEYDVCKRSCLFGIDSIILSLSSNLKGFIKQNSLAITFSIFIDGHAVPLGFICHF